MRVTIYTDKLSNLKEQIDEAFAEVVSEFGLECQAVIEDEDEFADIGLPNRDIVLTGRLRDSQLVHAATDRDVTTASYRWDPVDPQTGRHYAGDVFVGFGRLPGRNWPDRAVRRVDWLKVFASEVKARVQGKL